MSRSSERIKSRITQLLPAEGWFAVYADEKSGTTERERVVCFALLETPGVDDRTREPCCNQQVEPMVFDPDEGIDFCRLLHNFLGISHRDDWAEDERRFTNAARRYAKLPVYD